MTIWNKARSIHNRKTPTSRPMTKKTVGEKRPYGVHCPHGYAECAKCTPWVKPEWSDAAAERGWLPEPLVYETISAARAEFLGQFGGVNSVTRGTGSVAVDTVLSGAGSWPPGTITRDTQR